ncbi:MAG: DUF192 domain-containing protein [Holosporales bacterium]|nr:DUF192 domain-containing protein [Holosporales bacterium]
MHQERSARSLRCFYHYYFFLISFACYTAQAQNPTLNIANKVPISIETANTPQARHVGFMFRRLVSPKHGMLFDFQTTQSVVMWMKNTYVSLDLLFISQKGVITHMIQKAEPLSTKALRGKKPVRFVLEVPAGTCEKYGIVVGDTVSGLPTESASPQRRDTKRKPAPKK